MFKVKIEESLTPVGNLEEEKKLLSSIRKRQNYYFGVRVLQREVFQLEIVNSKLMRQD